MAPASLPADSVRRDAPLLRHHACRRHFQPRGHLTVDGSLAQGLYEGLP